MSDRPDLPPVRGPGEALGWMLVAMGGAAAVLAALSPWVRVPVGFERLRVVGTDRPQGVAALVAGVALLAVAAAAARRPGWRFPVARVAGAAVVFGLVTVVTYVQVDATLHREVPGVGVHPGTQGSGVRLLALATGFVGAAAMVVARARRRRPRPDAPG